MDVVTEGFTVSCNPFKATELSNLNVAIDVISLSNCSAVSTVNNECGCKFVYVVN